MRAAKLLSPLVCLLLLAGCGAGTGDAGSSNDGDGPVLLPIPNEPAVSFRVWFKVGSQDDPAGKEGLAYLTSSLLANGGTANRSYEEVLEALYPLAAGYGGNTDKEMTSFSGRAHVETLDEFFGLYTDAFLNPGFAEADFERLKISQLNYLEKMLRYSSDEELGKAAFQSLVFAGTPYEHPPEGTVQGVQSITLDDVKAFYAQHYTRDNAVIALGGGYPESLVGQFEEAISGLPEGTEQAATPAPTPAQLDGHRVLLIDKPGADASISFGFPIAVRRGDDDFYALWVANSWLGEHRNSSSHLYGVIREARGMNYGDYSYLEWFPNGGGRQFPPTNVGRRVQNFEVWIRTLPNEQAHFALRAAIREIDKLITDGMSEEDFQLTRTFLTNYILHYADSTSQRLGYAVDDRYYGIDGEGHLARFREKMASLTRDQVNAAIRRHLRTDRLAIAMITGAAEDLKVALAEDRPSPMTYALEKPAEILAEDEEIAAFALGIDAGAIETIAIDSIFEGEAPAATEEEATAETSGVEAAEG